MVQSCVAFVEVSELILMLYYKYTWPIIYLGALATWQFRVSIISYRMCGVRLYNMRGENNFAYSVSALGVYLYCTAANAHELYCIIENELSTIRNLHAANMLDRGGSKV